MGKRKRNAVSNGEAVAAASISKKSKARSEPTEEGPPEPSTSTTPTKEKSSTAMATPPEYEETIQVVTGSYDQVLHGLTATIRVKTGNKAQTKVDFADTFLFLAHSSALRCVAVSPPSAPTPGQAQKVLLASGATDERINIYELSAHPPRRQEHGHDALSAVTPRPVLENRRNRRLGALLHHSASITSLRFPTRGKLLSSADDSTIAVTRTRDWSTLSSIKAPVPNMQGRPSGDTAPLGGAPSGVNDFAVHPSMKLMISVSKGERSMRLWNLMTGKKAGVLNFERALLQEIGEGARHSSGEGRRVVWGAANGADEFAVVFEKDVVVFGMDSVPKCRLMTAQRTKVHQAAYVSLGGSGDGPDSTVLAVATEDGRILFFSTKDEHISPPPEGGDGKQTNHIGTARLLAQLGGKEDNVNGRIKEFSIIRSAVDTNLAYAIGASSDGRVRLWTVDLTRLMAAPATMAVTKIDGRSTERSSKKKEGDVATGATGPAGGASEGTDRPVGTLQGTYETQNRITCLAAYLMIPRGDGVEDSDDAFGEEEEEDEDEDESSDDDGE